PQTIGSILSVLRAKLSTRIILDAKVLLVWSHIFLLALCFLPLQFQNTCDKSVRVSPSQLPGQLQEAVYEADSPCFSTFWTDSLPGFPSFQFTLPYLSIPLFCFSSECPLCLNMSRYFPLDKHTHLHTPAHKHAHQLIVSTASTQSD